MANSSRNVEKDGHQWGGTHAMTEYELLCWEQCKLKCMFDFLATTVASTMALAHRAGINTFVTGGVGGVHRNGQVSMDISMDLIEMSRTPVVVI